MNGNRIWRGAALSAMGTLVLGLAGCPEVPSLEMTEADCETLDEEVQTCLDESDDAAACADLQASAEQCWAAVDGEDDGGEDVEDGEDWGEDDEEGWGEDDEGCEDEWDDEDGEEEECEELAEECEQLDHELDECLEELGEAEECFELAVETELCWIETEECFEEGWGEDDEEDWDEDDGWWPGEECEDLEMSYLECAEQWGPLFSACEAFLAEAEQCWAELEEDEPGEEEHEAFCDELWMEYELCVDENGEDDEACAELHGVLVEECGL